MGWGHVHTIHENVNFVIHSVYLTLYNVIMCLSKCTPIVYVSHCYKPTLAKNHVYKTMFSHIEQSKCWRRATRAELVSNSLPKDVRIAGTSKILNSNSVPFLWVSITNQLR